MARQLMSCPPAQTFPSWQVLLADLRCHGQSAHMGPGMPNNSVESAAADVLELLRHLRLFPEILIGHSFGGKVIMSMADQFGRIGPRLPRPVQVHCTSSAASPASFCLCITKGQIWLGPVPLQHMPSLRTGRPCTLQARPAMADAGLQHALCHLQCLPCTPYAKLLGAWQAQTSESANKQMLLCPAQVWVLDALPGSMAEAAGPELRHRKDHPQDLIDRLQVSSSSPCALHSHHWDPMPPSNVQAQALMSKT